MMNNVVSFCLATALLMAGFESEASDDAYLQMLEGEAESLELDQSGQLQNDDIATVVKKKKQARGKKGFGWTGTLEGDNLPDGLEPEQFESILQDNFYGTYLFYSKLNSSDKRTVYYRYQKAESKSLENVRKNILELMKR